eukprot:g14981.t1
MSPEQGCPGVAPSEGYPGASLRVFQEATCEYALSLLERNQIPLQEASHALSEPVAPGSQPADWANTAATAPLNDTLSSSSSAMHHDHDDASSSTSSKLRATSDPPSLAPATHSFPTAS